MQKLVFKEQNMQKCVLVISTFYYRNIMLPKGESMQNPTILAQKAVRWSDFRVIGLFHLHILQTAIKAALYSSVRNKRAGRNKRAPWRIL